ncbi:MAG TPA: hypothetical protein PKD15_00780 [Candidatus Saccharibacteria bacterium]|nr:hypothetical protein [Candidatus Saccharibacteria bacterium]
MPQFDTHSNVVEVILPSTKDLPKEEQSIVYMDISPQKAGDMLGMNTHMTDAEKAFSVMVRRIKDWNYVDSNNEPMPININTVGLLKTEDFEFLQSKIAEEPQRLDADTKKDSPSTLQINVTENDQA